MTPTKLFKKNFFFLVYIKKGQDNIMFMAHIDNSYAMVDLYQNNKFFGYKGSSYNYYDIDVKKILLIRNSYKEYFIRY